LVCPERSVEALAAIVIVRAFAVSIAPRDYENSLAVQSTPINIETVSWRRIESADGEVETS
jgi:hypothetical protein